MTEAHGNPLDPAVVSLRLDNLERRMQNAEDLMKPLPVLIRDVDKGFTAVDDRIDDLTVTMNERMKTQGRVLWVFATAFITTAIGSVSIAVQMAAT
jgi:hypothetical protein